MKIRQNHYQNFPLSNEPNANNRNRYNVTLYQVKMKLSGPSVMIMI